MRYAIDECECVGRYILTFTGPCTVCGDEQAVAVTADEMDAYKKGAKIQNAMRRLTCYEREFLMSGICRKCFQALEED